MKRSVTTVIARTRTGPGAGPTGGILGPFTRLQTTNLAKEHSPNGARQLSAASNSTSRSPWTTYGREAKTTDTLTTRGPGAATTSSKRYNTQCCSLLSSATFHVSPALLGGPKSAKYSRRAFSSDSGLPSPPKSSTATSATSALQDSINYINNANRDPPPVTPYWFFATDVTKREPDFLLQDSDREKKLVDAMYIARGEEPPPDKKKKKELARPKKFQPFSEQDNELLESRFQKLLKQKQQKQKLSKDAYLVPVREDFLFEVDVETMEISPLYWDGPVFEVRRSEWLLMDGSNAIPCSQQLNDQLEQGFVSKKPWLEMKEKSISIKNSMEEVAAGTSTNWVLKGERYQGKLCVYSTDCQTAWIMSNDVYGMLTAAFLQKIATGAILGASKLVRGYDHVKKEESRDEKKARDGKDKGKDKDGKPRDVKGSPQSKSAPNLFTTPAEKIKSRYGPESSQKKEQQEMEEDYVDDQAYAGSHVTHSGTANAPYDHLVLCVHGIGQKLGRRIKSVNFVHDVNVLRKTIKAVFNDSKSFSGVKKSFDEEAYAATFSEEHDDKEKNKVNWVHPRVQVLPVLWRSQVTFNLTKADILQHHGDPNSAVCLQDITVDGLSSVRNITGDVILDVLLYYQPFYRRQINEAVVAECNRIVQLFKKHNPKFNGRVSIIGHSLGSVISFDVLSNQPEKGAEEELASSQILDFDVENYFMMGSPVGLFKILEGSAIRARGDSSSPVVIANETKFQPTNAYMSPKVNQLYNIFHPSDPISYRVEPLIDKLAAFMRPASVPFTKSGFSTESISNLGRQVAEGATQVWNTIYTSGENITQTLLNAASFLEKEDAQSKALAAKEAQGTQEEHGEQPVNDKSEFPSTSSISKRKLTKEENARVVSKLGTLSKTGRIDYALQEGVLDLGFIAAIASHISYLEDEDVACFVLQRLLDDKRREVEAMGDKIDKK